MGEVNHILHLPFDSTTKLCFVLLGLPLFTFWFLILFGRVINKYRGYLATTIMLASLIIALIIFEEVWFHQEHHARWVWAAFSDKFVLTIGIKLGKLSSLFLLIVSLVSFLVHLFSIEYLRGDRNFEKYFAYLGLFTYSMFNIVISDNLLQIFIFWELVGFCSYLLIGFWYRNEKSVQANKKAFLMNRVGDIGFLLGMLILWASFGTLDLQTLIENFNYAESVDAVTYGVIGKKWLIVAGLGIFMGCVGKSAQFPLQTWLPDAMQGPTPVSALIHAATMVAAGIYLIAKVYPLLHPDALTVIAYVGAITAFMGAFAALAQNDIKRVLAFSTISQLGYMVMALGAREYQAALFHLVTHAFFKACLFLCSGAIIHSMHVLHKELGIHEDVQDMKLMGGLRKKMPVTFLTFTIACASLIGLPLFSGFLSKDAVLAGALTWSSESGGHALVPILGFGSVLLTALYMGRQWFLVFWGDFRLDEKIKGAYSKLKEAPLLMQVPTVILAALSLFFVFSPNPFDAHAGWVYEMLEVPQRLVVLPAFNSNHGNTSTVAMVVSLIMASIGISVAYLLYAKQSKALMKFKEKVFSDKSLLRRLSFNNWYLDEVYNVVFISPVIIFSNGVALFDRYVVDKIVNYTALVTRAFAHTLGYVETNVVNKLVEKFAVLNVVGAELLGWIDSNLIDGIVTLTAKAGMGVGSLAKSIQGGKVQSYLLISISLLIGLLLLLILL